MKRGEDLIQDLREQGFMRCETTSDGKAVVMRRRDRWTVVPLRWLTDEAVDTIKAQAGVGLV
ncbi:MULTISPECIES: hypothetical protein [Streptomyces]|uniref:Uncharacterized protein n=1 Tax=Streptomyces hiroshimensis TaxID=66424 RepID=A0ABQ2Y7Z3_9ACTN|nr:MULTISPECIES: hypothetical protein [Streptomyces]QLE71881.1 hypothetical protein FGW37_09935 [Streptomyces rectiverticillatus]GGX71969.1 hypothetical protein GCM10010324_16480 [Streptomyces hiroshimensis]